MWRVFDFSPGLRQGYGLHSTATLKLRSTRYAKASQNFIPTFTETLEFLRCTLLEFSKPV